MSGIDWDDVANWGNRVHVASSGNWGPDAGHDDDTSDQ